MTLAVPQWYALIQLGLASWRIYQLLSDDEVLDRPRRWLLRLDVNWAPGQPVEDTYRLKLARFITCPYCFGFWIAVAWWAAWEIWPHATLIAAAPLAISALLIGAAKLLSQ
jgi:hypothetical protein